jgi:heme-degrading monooxygenase HmoA
MLTAITITKFRTTAIPFAFIGMAVLRLPLWLNRKCKFWKLLGTGKNAQVDLAPNFKHWGVLTTWQTEADCRDFYSSSFVIKWFRFFGMEEFTVLAKPLYAHGLWSKKEPFTKSDSGRSSNVIAVLTRASIRLNRVKEFNQHIKQAADNMRKADGYILSFGFGEIPLLSQGTFSIWRDAESMKAYAYGTAAHADVIKKTRTRNWYSEELFARFEIVDVWGSLNNETLKLNIKS